jgi:hypothetical protein
MFKKARKPIIIIALSTLIAGNVMLAKESLKTSACSSQINRLRQTFYKAINSSDYVDEGLELASEIDCKKGKNIDDSIVKAYNGAFLCFAARDSIWPAKKWRLANEGLTKLDSAVADFPEAIELRLLRGSISYNLPFFFKRRDEARIDLDFILERLDSEDFLALENDLKKLLLNFLLTTNLKDRDKKLVTSTLEKIS